MKRVEIARALATQPRLLLLDEVMAGLNPTEVQEAVTLLRRIHAQGITLLIVEHVMEAIIPVCQRIVVLDAGQKIMEGMPDEVLNDQRVIKAYLGDRYHATG
jgi:ABC-type branched-subunit amino acid transport system ATPase component